jgi:hypothetical protein
MYPFLLIDNLEVSNKNNGIIDSIKHKGKTILRIFINQLWTIKTYALSDEPCSNYKSIQSMKYFVHFLHHVITCFYLGKQEQVEDLASLSSFHLVLF